MYDLVKRKHDQTPTPEKHSNRSSIHKQQDQQEETEEEEDDEEDDDEEDDDDDGDDDDDDDDDDDGDGEEEKDYKGYQLRQRRPIPNRYTAPPLKTCSRGLLEFPCLLALTSKVIILISVTITTGLEIAINTVAFVI